MAEINTDVVHLEYANREVFAVGNGQVRLFPLTVGGKRIRPTQIDEILINDGSVIFPAVGYVINEGNVVFTSPLPNGSVAMWSGTGYWTEVEPAQIVPPIDVKVGMTWRLDQSPNLNTMLDEKNEWYRENFTTFWSGWFDSVFRLKGANTFGVAVWAYILGVPLGVIGLDEKYRYWGFGPQRGNYRANWTSTEDQPSSGNFPPTGVSISTQWEKIAALRIRYYALTLNCSIASINRALQDVFGEVGLAYVLDGEDMSMTYVFDFPISTSFRNAMLQYGLLPKPAGVRLNIQAP